MRTLKRRALSVAAALAAGLTIVAGAASAQPARVFVTSTSQTGALGGLASADAMCETRAQAATLGGGPWVAWLSTSSVDAVDRLTPGSGPFVRASTPSTVIANDIAGLLADSLQESILLDEFGNPRAGIPLNTVWTGTGRDGRLIDPASCAVAGPNCNCADWTTEMAGGSTGGAEEANFTWTAIGSASCRGSLSIYCFEAPEAVPAVTPLALFALTTLLIASGIHLLRRSRPVGRFHDT